jgi:hypothetical protein
MFTEAFGDFTEVKHLQCLKTEKRGEPKSPNINGSDSAQTRITRGL